MPPTKFPFRLGLIAAALLASIDDASALGLGELRTRSHLGERLIAEVEVLTSGKEVLDAGCFRLRAPLDEGGLPWLKDGNFNLRRGSPAVLEIRSNQPVREPALQVGLMVACGHEVQRDYTLLFSPRGSEPQPLRPEASAPIVQAAPPRRVAPAPAVAEAPPPAFSKAPAPLRRSERRAKPAPLPDRLVLSGDPSPAGEASLRLATNLAGWREKTSDALEAQREILRLEYRMLTVLAEQATTQLAAADKLRTMEETLAALRSRTDDLTSRMEKGAPVAQSAPPPAAPQPPVATPANVAPPEEKSSFLSEWSFYGALLGAVFGIGGWLGWQQYRQRRELRLEPSFADLEPVTEPTIETPPPASPEVDLDVGAAVPEGPWRVDMPMEYLERPDADITVVEDHGHFAETEAAQDEAETDEEVPEANPVMELAEIMLSFGRVKGAAQALQEYIDQNPEEALKPWIRLMDVYRMAGMREDFERLARDLNQHFNVEIQQWERASQEMMAPLAAFDLVLVPQGEELPVASAESARKGLELEDFDHIRQRLTELWGSDDCTEYLDHLLRDNRGGQRNGFALPVVEDILFLMELHQTRNSLDKQTMDGEKNE